MGFWVNNHYYACLEDAIAASEEYRRNMEILEGEGLVPLPHNVNFHHYWKEIVPGVLKEVSAYDTLGNKIATWTAYKSTAAKDTISCRNCGAPVRSSICEYCGTVY